MEILTPDGSEQRQHQGILANMGASNVCGLYQSAHQQYSGFNFTKDFRGQMHAQSPNGSASSKLVNLVLFNIMTSLLVL